MEYGGWAVGGVCRCLGCRERDGLDGLVDFDLGSVVAGVVYDLGGDLYCYG